MGIYWCKLGCGAFDYSNTGNQDLRSCSRIRDVALWDVFGGCWTIALEILVVMMKTKING